MYGSDAKIMSPSYARSGSGYAQTYTEMPTWQHPHADGEITPTPHGQASTQTTRGGGKSGIRGIAVPTFDPSYR